MSESLVQLTQEYIERLSIVKVNFFHNNRVLICKSVVMGEQYIRVEAYELPDKEDSCELLIPHHFVELIVPSAEESSFLGFVQD